MIAIAYAEKNPRDLFSLEPIMTEMQNRNIDFELIEIPKPENGHRHYVSTILYGENSFRETLIENSISTLILHDSSLENFLMAQVATELDIPVVQTNAGKRNYAATWQDDSGKLEAYSRSISDFVGLSLTETEDHLLNLRSEMNYGESFLIGNLDLCNCNGIKKYREKVITIVLNDTSDSSRILQLNDLANHYNDYEFRFLLQPGQNKDSGLVDFMGENSKLKWITFTKYHTMMTELAHAHSVITDSESFTKMSNYLEKPVLLFENGQPESYIPGYKTMYHTVADNHKIHEMFNRVMSISPKKLQNKLPRKNAAMIATDYIMAYRKDLGFVQEAED